MKFLKIMLRFVALMVLMLIIALGMIYINHQIQLKNEEALRIPLGILVEVDGNRMSVYTEGDGDKTIVFMSGGGTCSPILDFRSLYSQLSDHFRIAVIEKYGYGFSDVVDSERQIASILEESRAALKNAGVEGPYILCPHSMSGIEAIYWAQQYPEEVEAIIGLDMAVPEAYENYHINMPMLKLSQFAARVGIIRLLPGISESDAIRFGTLTEKETAIYRAVFYNRTATKTMLNEVKWIKQNAETVRQNGVPQVPILLFVSNGVGTGWDAEAWRAYQRKYLSNTENGKIIELDCPHYVHDYLYEVIAKEITAFLTAMPNE